MIELNVSNNNIENSFKTEELHNYLLQQRYDVMINNSKTKKAKSDLATNISIASLGISTFAMMYPIIKDIFIWSQRYKYSITIQDGNKSATINNLSEKDFLLLTKQLKIEKSNIVVTNNER